MTLLQFISRFGRDFIEYERQRERKREEKSKNARQFDEREIEPKIAREKTRQDKRVCMAFKERKTRPNSGLFPPTKYLTLPLLSCFVCIRSHVLTT